jgi:Tfp pilus assembly protein PilN
MIEINLLPGSGKKARSRGPGINLGAALSGVFRNVTDPYLLAAVATVAASGVLIGFFFLKQSARNHYLTEREQKAQQDSIRYAAVLKEKRKAEAQRDSVLVQLNIIKQIDNDRFVWPHVMDEVSRALPPYTWLVSVTYTASAPAAPPAGAPADAAKKKKEKTPADSAPPPPLVKFRLVGNTVDMQALARFLRMLEQSPFIQNVQLVKSDQTPEQGKMVSRFEVDAEYQRPDSTAVRTVPITLSVR